MSIPRQTLNRPRGNPVCIRGERNYKKPYRTREQTTKKDLRRQKPRGLKKRREASKTSQRTLSMPYGIANGSRKKPKREAFAQPRKKAELPPRS
jgi:hypothetical protein